MHRPNDQNEKQGEDKDEEDRQRGSGGCWGSWVLHPGGQAQTLNMMKSLDAPHYDGHRTTWSPASDIVNMIQDTLVALDWDGKTVLPYLAKSPGR